MTKEKWWDKRYQNHTLKMAKKLDKKWDDFYGIFLVYFKILKIIRKKQRKKVVFKLRFLGRQKNGKKIEKWEY